MLVPLMNEAQFLLRISVAGKSDVRAVEISNGVCENSKPTPVLFLQDIFWRFFQLLSRFAETELIIRNSIFIEAVPVPHPGVRRFDF